MASKQFNYNILQGNIILYQTIFLFFALFQSQKLTNASN